MGGETIWACCSCGDGPNLVAVQISCPQCEHARCSNCNVENTGKYEKFDVPAPQSQIQFTATDNSEISESASSLIFTKDSSSSVLAFKASVPSPSPPFDSEDIKYEDTDTLETRRSIYAIEKAHVSFNSSSDEELSIEMSPTPVSEDLETIILYEGPLLNLNSKAVTIIIHAYEQFRSRGTSDDDKNVTSNDEPAADNTLNSTESSEGPNSTSSQLKRKSADHNTNEDDEERKRRHKHKSVPGSQESKKKPFLACQFYKFDPQKHRCCCTLKLDAISRIRQHLFRSHKVPKHCPACFKEFKTDEDLEAHSRLRPICELSPPKTLDGVTASQKEKLQERFSLKKTTEQKWYTMFEILFPGAPRPRSPYVDTELSEKIEELRNFMVSNGPAVVDDLIVGNFPSDLLPVDDEVQTWVRSMIPTVINALFERFQDSDRRVERSVSQVREEHTNRDSGYYSINQDEHSSPSQEYQMPTGSIAPPSPGERHEFEAESPPPPFDVDDLFDFGDHPEFYFALTP